MTEPKNVSLKGVAQQRSRIENKLRQAADKAAEETGKHGLHAVASDSFVNFAQKMGVGADNPLTTAGYGFNPITRIRTVLEWIHRGSWLGGVAIDLVADDMTRAGIEITGQMKPEEMQKIHGAAVRCRIWESINAAYKWSRLYGGGLAVMMVDGQDPSTPLRIETVGKGQFKGLMVLDRWMVEPTMEKVIEEAGPDMGLPKFYNVRQDAPGMRAGKIHHSRCLRLVGVELPYWQAVIEQMWGISVLERLWDRMTAFDSGTTGIAQLIYKAYIRTYKIKGLRNIVAAGGKPLQGLIAQVDLMRRTQSMEGITLMDMDDEFEAMQTVPFSGISDALLQLGQQLSGALQIPLVRLFGQSPAGLNATGESDLRMYYDNINKEQNKSVVAITNIYRVLARSEGVDVKDDFGIKFKSLWQLTDKEKAEIAETTQRAVSGAEESGLISQQTAMKELKQSSHITGIFSNITDEEINAAEVTLPPAGEEAAQQELEAAKELASHGAEEGRKTEVTKAKLAPKPAPGTKDNAVTTVAAMKLYHNLDVVVESEKGSVRRGKGPVAWEAMLAADYGYVRRTMGDDGDPVDCFVGPNPESAAVWIIKQIDPSTGLPDEDKAMLGFKDRATALATYRASYSDDASKRIGFVAAMGMDDFKGYLAARPDRAQAAQPPGPVVQAQDAVHDTAVGRALKSMADSADRMWARVMDLASRPAAPNVSINVPEIKIPDIHIPQPVVHVQAPRAPEVRVNVPAPVVHVAAPQVHVKGYPTSSNETVHRDPVSKEITNITRENKD